jgi:hypothetical protein
VRTVSASDQQVEAWAVAETWRALRIAAEAAHRTVVDAAADAERRAADAERRAAIAGVAAASAAGAASQADADDARAADDADAAFAAIYGLYRDDGYDDVPLLLWSDVEGRDISAEDLAAAASVVTAWPAAEGDEAAEAAVAASCSREALVHFVTTAWISALSASEAAVDANANERKAAFTAEEARDDAHYAGEVARRAADALCHAAAFSAAVADAYRMARLWEDEIERRTEAAPSDAEDEAMAQREDADGRRYWDDGMNELPHERA